MPQQGKSEVKGGRCTPAPRLGAALVALALLAACGGSGESRPPPTGVTAVAGDGRVTVSWSSESGVQYWLFSAADATLTPTRWSQLSEGRAMVNATSPADVCGLINGRQYWFTLNARSGDAGGGDGSPLVSATPRAAGGTWTAAPPLAAPLDGVAYAALTTCLTNPQSTASGLYVAVGPGATIYTSANGADWTARSAPAAFATDLHAVAGYAAQINAPSNPGLLLVAVGAGGASLFSTDGATWVQGRAFDSARPTLRRVALAARTFVAVGDEGTIETSNDGIAWTAQTSGTTANLHGVAFANTAFIAVGDGGTVVRSVDGVTWTAQTVPGVGNLRAVAYGNLNLSVDNGGVVGINTFVAVGDAGVAAVSTDNGLTWTARPVAPGSPLTGVAYTTRFVAVSAGGAAYTSSRGDTWSGPIGTGAANLRAVTAGANGFVAVGGAGATARSF